LHLRSPAVFDGRLSGLEQTIQYHGQTITVRAVLKDPASVSYEPHVVITGSRQLLNPTGKYPPRLFATPKEAIEYGIEAAKYIIDNPPATVVRPKKKRLKDKEKKQ
jgi:hypothetical protein